MDYKFSLNFGLPTLLFLVFMILKLTGVIAWSWWWVTAPLWIWFGILVILIVLFVIVAKYEKRRKERFTRG